MIQLSSTTLDDFAYIARRMREDEQDQWCALVGRAEYDADLCARGLAAINGPSFTLLSDGTPFCIGGFDPIRPGVYQTWMAGTLAGWVHHWRAITKNSRRLMDHLLANGAHRIQTIALASRVDAHEWYARGLQQSWEGVHRGWYADGRDAVCYARVKEV